MSACYEWSCVFAYSRLISLNIDANLLSRQGLSQLVSRTQLPNLRHLTIKHFHGTRWKFWSCLPVKLETINLDSALWLPTSHPNCILNLPELKILSVDLSQKLVYEECFTLMLLKHG